MREHNKIAAEATSMTSSAPNRFRISGIAIARASSMTPATKTYTEFMADKYWPSLDGLRTVSITLVFVGHMSDGFWPHFRGALGVVLFFILSGFLITSLLIREERTKARVSLGKFYVRRAFRIVPLYYAALLISSILVLRFGFGDQRRIYLDRLPYLATFNGDLTYTGTFVHSWSVGIEEKFYILWPIIGFSVAGLCRRRLTLLCFLTLSAMICAYLTPVTYFGRYTGILLGCLLAVLMHRRMAYGHVAKLSTPIISKILLLLLVLAFVLDRFIPGSELSGHAHVPFAIFATLVFPSLLIRNGWLFKALSWRPIVFIGTRTYAIYLFHPLAIDVVGFAIPPGQDALIPAATRFGLAALLAYGTAETLHRIYEAPLIRLGRHLGGVTSISSGFEKRPTSAPTRTRKS